jgi:hypothetical protein
MLMGVSAFGQKQKFIIVKTYKNGVATVSKIIPIAMPAPAPVVVPVVKAKPKVKIKTVTKTVEVPVEVVKTVVDDRKIDSLQAVIMSYNVISNSTDSYLLEHNQGIVVVKEQLVGNKIINRQWTADIQPIVKTKEKIVEIYRPKTVQWYMGPLITTNFSQPFQSFGLSVVRKNLNDNLLQFQIGGNVHEGSMRPNPYMGIGMLLKLN